MKEEDKRLLKIGIVMNFFIATLITIFGVSQYFENEIEFERFFIGLCLTGVVVFVLVIIYKVVTRKTDEVKV